MIKKTILGMMLIAMGTTAMAQGLKDAYKDYFMIGVAVNQRNVTNAEQSALIKKELDDCRGNDQRAVLCPYEEPYSGYCQPL